MSFGEKGKGNRWVVYGQEQIGYRFYLLKEIVETYGMPYFDIKGLIPLFLALFFPFLPLLLPSLIGGGGSGEKMAGNDGHEKMFVCARDPPRVMSNGILRAHNKLRAPFVYTLPLIEMEIVLIFLLTYSFHLPLKRLGFPKIVSEISAGLVLGTTGLSGQAEWQYFLFPATGQGVLGTTCAFGYLLFQFLSGVKMNTKLIRITGARTIVIGVTNLVVPLIVGWITLRLMPIYHPENENEYDQRLVQNGANVLVSHSMTAFPVVTVLLKDLKILNSELGRLAMACSLITHLLQVTLSSVIAMYSVFLRNHIEGIISIVMCIAFILIVVFLIRPTFVWVVKQTPEGKPVKDLYIFSTILLVLVSAVVSYWFELAVLFGPFVIGLAVPEGPPLGSALVDKLEALSSGVLLPTFVTLVTLRTDLVLIRLSSPHIALILVSLVAKIVSTALVARCYKMPVNDAVALGLILSIKGVVDLANYSFVRDAKMIDQPTFSLLVVATVMIAAFVPYMVRLLYDPDRRYAGYHKRSIMHSRTGGKLPVLACIHSTDNIMSIIRLLDASSPTTESPILLNVLHLIELRGQASPIFISHQVQKKTKSGESYSGKVVIVFKQYERRNPGAVIVNAYTAISPRKLMHEDICTLSLNVLASIIIVPFHRKWSLSGSVESEDSGLRTLNRNVLDKAPCSVGILVDRGSNHHALSSLSSLSSMSYTVAVIFLGGNDDYESLALAKRMTKNRNLGLTVVRCTAPGEEMDEDLKVWLYGCREMNNVNYHEEAVIDCSELAVVLRSVADVYDLVLVGKNGGMESPLVKGLEEWCDVPELGPVGDFLASGDLLCRASVLVVQQQKYSSS